MQQESLSRVRNFAQGFDLAFSFTEMMRGSATDLHSVAESLGFRSYLYTEELVRQSGIRIERLTHEIYTERNSVIVGCRNYGHSAATSSELAAIRFRLERFPDAKTILVRYAESAGNSSVLSEFVRVRSSQVIVVDADHRLMRSRNLFSSTLIKEFH